MISISENDQAKEQSLLKKVSRQRLKNILTTVCFILFLSIGFFVVTGLLRTYSVDFCLHILRQEAQNTKNNMNRHIATFQNDMDVLASLIEQEDDLTSVQVQKTLECYESKNIISHLGILFPDDQVMLPDGSFTASPDTASFDKLAEKGPFFSNLEPDAQNPDHGILYYSIPIRSSHEEKGILFGVIDLETISHYFEINMFDGKASLYIVDPENMNLILDTLHGHPGANDAKKGRQIKSGFSEDQIIQDFADGKSGLTAYFSTSHREYLYTAYEPIDVNHWFLLLSVPESTVLEGAEYIKTILFRLGIFEGIVLITYFLWILLRSKQEMKSKETEIRHIYYMYSIQQTLFDAYRQPENILISLEQVAQATTARTILLSAIADEEVCRTFTWQNSAADADSKKRPRQIAQVLSEDMLLRHSGYTISAEHPSLQADEKIREAMNCFGITNLMAIPIEGQKHRLVGILAAMDMEQPCHTTDLLTSVAFSFSMALYNIRAYETIERMGTTDSLTNLRNRNSYEHILEQYEKSRPNRLTCVYADANGLHELNNSQGHTAGDKMLQFVAHALTDAFEDGMVYRIGGDEFLVLTDMDLEEAAELAAKAKQKTEENGYHVSIGTASGGQTDSPASIIKTAEQKMYEDKKQYYMGSNDRRKMR